MLNFIDTNVLMGYCFEAHNYNDQCQILETMTNLWLSEKVLAEWDKKEKKVYNELDAKIQLHVQGVRRMPHDMLEIDHRDRLIGMTDRKVRPFFQRLYLEDILFPIAKTELCDKIDSILLQMRSDRLSRFSKLISLCQKHVRTRVYSSEESALLPCVHNGDGDRGIILDAHDLVLDPTINKQNEDLLFWTFDGGISDICKEKILSNLQIANVIDLKYHMPFARPTS